MIGNAAGTCKSVEGVRDLVRYLPEGSTITVGSYRPEPFEGNPGVTEFRRDGVALNWKGIPTPMPFARLCDEVVPEMVGLVANHHKLCVSVHAEAVATIHSMVTLAVAAGAHEVEVNTACPNTDAGEMLCFNAPAMRELAKALSGFAVPVGIKAGVYSNPSELIRMAGFMGRIDFFTVCNTFPNGLLFDDEGTPCIGSATGYGGVSGAALKAIALGQVSQWRAALLEGKRVKGVGGVSTRRDYIDMRSAGADEVQVGTAFYFSPLGARFFESLAYDVADLVVQVTP